ncbi:MAG: hypothetical protein E7773_06030 [Sphingomonas sp.]|uniref:hypothetical protein n=1 Tax=Sphingomonas sp. TaxID=28214 RepID=UPI001223AB28|nr:hypothetical protein [Sphingomonas sp.]THD36569.1 MAG: hypothetical protein E7773_06030 [Sphingomonas sp.]
MLGTVAIMLAVGGMDDPTMTITPVPGKGYSISIESFPAKDKPQVSARMIEKGIAKCGALKPRWGRFSFKTGYPNGAAGGAWVIGYRQALTCYDPANDPFKPAPADWIASEADAKEATAFANGYLDRFQTGDVRAVTMFEPMLEMTITEWVGQPNHVKGRLGRGTRRLAGPIWRLNPTEAAHPGAYAMFGFLGQYSGMRAYCGMLMVYRVAPGQYQITAENMQTVTNDDVSSGRVSASVADQSCRDMLK